MPEIKEIDPIPIVDWVAIDKNSKAKGVDHKFRAQLYYVKDKQEKKLAEIIDMIEVEKSKYKELMTAGIVKEADLDVVPDIRALNDKLMRIAGKYTVVVEELNGRKIGKFGPGLEFDRVYHGTTYYIDLNAGNDSNTGLSIAQAWKTLEKFTILTVRTPGDIAYIRANTSEIPAADIDFDEDGDKDNLIYIIGCDSTTDPWGDGSNVKPIINFNSNTRSMHFFNDKYRKIQGIEIQGSTCLYGCIYIQTSPYVYIENCVFSSSSTGTFILESSGVTFTDCAFDGCSAGVRAYQGNYHFKGCTFDNCGYGVFWGDHSVRTEFTDCLFGQTTPNTTKDFYINYCDIQALFRNSKWNSYLFNPNTDSYIFSEDDQQVAGANKMYGSYGNITKDTSIVRTGGGNSSLLFEPDAICGLYQPLEMHENSDFAAPFRFWLTKDIETTLTIYIRATAAWGTYPTASELYCEASYLNHATLATRATVNSTAVLSDGSTWVPFTMTFTPLQTGFTYVKTFLKLYEAGKSINVDIKPICSQAGVGYFEWTGGKPFILSPQTEYTQPTISDFSASVSEANPGDSVTLSWTASGGVSASINEGVGSVDPGSGTKVVSPTDTTTYILTVTSATGLTKTASVKVTVVSYQDTNISGTVTPGTTVSGEVS